MSQKSLVGRGLSKSARVRDHRYMGEEHIVHDPGIPLYGLTSGGSHAGGGDLALWQGQAPGPERRAKNSSPSNRRVVKAISGVV